MDLKQLIKKHLDSVELMQVATVNNGQPWICTVNFTLDENLNLYWMSMRATRHSQEIANDSKVAAAIVIDPKHKICVHLEGVASEVKKEDMEKANGYYSLRYGNKPARLEEALSDDPKVRSYYVIKPTLFVLFDESNEGNERQELAL